MGYNDTPVRLVEELGNGKVKTIAEGITYGEAVLCLQVMHNAGIDAMRYDIVRVSTGRLMSWMVQ
jgi:hypothetical protein